MIRGVTVKTRVPRWRAENPELEIVSLEIPAKKRQVVAIGYPKPDLSYTCHANNESNMVTSVLERLLYVEIDGKFVRPPKPTTNVRIMLLGFTNKLVYPQAAVLERREFPLLYHGRKRTIYQNAVESLENRPLAEEDAHIRQFIKLEKVKMDKRRAPRNISPRDPRYNVELGCFLKLLEHRLCSAVGDVFGEKVIFKGMNVFQQGRLIAKKWSRFRHPVGVGLDASRFDQSVGKEMLEWEHSIYEKCFRNCSGAERRRLRWLLSLQIVNVFKGKSSDAMVRHSGITARMSGDVNTGLGNCIIMCGMVYAYMDSLGFDVSEYALCNNGDDVVLIMEQHDLPKLSGVYNWFLQLGFRMQVETPVYTLEKLEFCQMQPVFDGERWRMMRSFSTALAKDCVSLKNLNGAKLFDRWVSAVGECGLAITSGLPCVQNMYRSWIKGKALKGDMAQESGFWFLSRGVINHGFRRPSDEARASFYMATGITPDGQVELEQVFDNYTPSFDGEYDETWPAMAGL